MVVRIGPFEIHEVVGKGGMGVVHRGIYRGPGTEVPVAVKFVIPPDPSQGNFRDAFVREVQSAARLDHPNIVGVYDMGEVYGEAAEQLGVPPDSPFLVMEYVEGGTLEEHVGSLDWPKLRSVLLSLLDALAHAHALGIVHRDLKPANVLCAGEGGELVPMLTDFGIARAMDTEPAEPQSDEPHRVAGTPFYMAPEHVMGRWRDEGPWTDIYALGALAWHLTTGGVPFPGNTGEVLRAHLMADLPSYAPAIDVPEAFEEWLRRLLDKDLTQRYRRAADAAWSLAQISDTVEGGETRTTRRLRTISVSPGPTLSGLTAQLARPLAAPAFSPSEGAVPKGGFAPPVPEDWRRGDEDGRRMLAGAGLGLFGLRPVPVVGREPGRSLLWHTLRQVHSHGRPHGVVVSGAPGSGKSRLVDWLAERAEEVGAGIVFRATHTRAGAASDGLVPMMMRFTRTQGLPFENVLMRVRSLYSDLNLRGEEALFDGVALTERILGRNPERSTGPRFQSRKEWFSALVRLFGALTRERPVILWLDDVHWSDESLQFAEHVLREVDQDVYPVYVVMTTADVDTLGTDDESRAPLERITNLANVGRIKLGPLSDDEMGDLVHRMLGLTPALAERVVERTSGNPLFAVQLVEDWVARGALELTDEGFAVPEDQSLELPDDVHETWQRRLREFVVGFDDPDAMMQSLEVGAVLGRAVDYVEWTTACSVLGITLPRGFVGKLVGAGLASRHDFGWVFAHGLLQESLQRRASEKDPVRYHRSCAEALEHRWPTPRSPRIAERLAGHWEAAGEPRRALDELAASVASHTEVAEHSAILRMARGALSLKKRHELEVDDVTAGSMHQAIASALRRMGDVDAAREHIDAAWEIVAGDRTALRFEDEPDAQKNPLLASLLVEEAILVFENEADLAQADDLLERAQRLAKAAEDPVALGWASKIRSRILCTMGRHEDGVEAARLAVEQYRQLRERRPDYYYSGLCELAGALRVAGKLGEAEQAMARADRYAGDVGSREALALAAMESAELARAQERFDDARAHYRTCEELFEMLGGKNNRLVELNMLLVDVESGDLQSPAPRLGELRAIFPDLGMDGFTPHVDLALAACHAAAGAWDDFDDALTQAREKLVAAGVREPELAGLAVIAAAAAAEGSARRARAALDLADELGGEAARPSLVAARRRAAGATFEAD